MFDTLELAPLIQRLHSMAADKRARHAFFLALEACPAGDALQLVLDGLADADDLTAWELGIVLGARERLISMHMHAQARDAARTVELMQSEFVAEEVVALLRRPMRAVHALLSLGLGMRGGGLHRTGAALEDGRLTYAQAVAVSEALTNVPDDVAEAVQSQVLPRAGELLPSQLGKATLAAVHELAPELADDDHARTKSDRNVFGWRAGLTGHGIGATGPTEQVAQIWAAIDQRAGRVGPEDTRTIDQRRFDALVALAGASLSDPSRPLRPDRPARPNLTLTLGTALGLRRKPGYLPGWGPITPQPAFEIANGEGARWQAWIVDAETHYLRGMATKSYQPSARLRRLNRARRECTLQPFSAIPSELCDDEHAQPYSQGGATDPANTGPLDQHAHRAKHEGGWRHRQLPDGTRIITSALGFDYTSRPTTYPVDHGDAEPAANWG